MFGFLGRFPFLPELCGKNLCGWDLSIIFLLNKESDGRYGWRSSSAVGPFSLLPINNWVRIDVIIIGNKAEKRWGIENRKDEDAKIDYFIKGDY